MTDMAELSQELLKILQCLEQRYFDQFKWYLKEDGILPVDLELAERWKTVDLMMEKYKGPGALKITMKILEDIGRNDLVDRLRNYQEPKDKSEDSNAHHPVNGTCKVATIRDELERVQQFAVDVTLDPDTAHPDLVLSKDGKQVYDSNVAKDLPDSSKRFNNCGSVLGKEKFSSGIFYFEVLVTDKTRWTIGVARESINRKGDIFTSPRKGFWTIWLKNKVYEALDNPSVCLPMKSRLQKVGVCVNYKDGLVSFYNVDTADLLYSFTDCLFNGDLLPYFCTNNSKGTNSAPLIICPVINKKNKAELKRVQQFAVEVTLDPDTAHPNLILSDDSKRVHHGDVRMELPDSPDRFNQCVSVLGKQSFSSGIVYYEVQVEGKTEWTVGVATQSIFRKEGITVKPENGFWTITLRNGDEVEANDTPAVRLHPRAHPQKVGVFLDYDKGLVSFYSVDTADLLYSFTGCCFAEKLLPYFCPWVNDGGSNSAPIIITTVNQFD
ncbi:probable E3 ubiquitin-protein ligase TRIML1 isoform X2 [Melanotaenia boesemani]|uniref:probable E3 ubiquitin-protein ligase TRIML1 isoform X2 n=1 Tax=Melanotaenia boesemani TaxID=1250792 RepID=UPI001C0454B7|nr:probable E3 ubiquitin-protein ligase TRIML1 isoform X2 [Melanotaenia boesemani]